MQKLINELSNDFYQTFGVRKLSFKDLDEVTKFVTKYYSFRQIFRVDQDALLAKDVMTVKEKLRRNASFGCNGKVSGRIVAVCSPSINDKHQNKYRELTRKLRKKIQHCTFYKGIHLRLEKKIVRNAECKQYYDDRYWHQSS